jgi:uncharacterized OB-fold protein
MTTTEKPIPRVDDLSRPFWEAANRGELTLQRCRECGQWRYPPSWGCPNCLSEGTEWAPVSGRGALYSWVVFHRSYHPAFEVPYNVAIVELEEGPRLMSNVVECSLEDLRVGMPLEVTFERVTEEITLPKFRPRTP